MFEGLNMFEGLMAVVFLLGVVLLVINLGGKQPFVSSNDNWREECGNGFRTKRPPRSPRPDPPGAQGSCGRIDK
jgi:hypothetical protein